MKTPGLILTLVVAVVVTIMNPATGYAAVCENCHKSVTPNIVSDWQLSKHGKAGMGCAVCHGEEHNSIDTVAKAKIPTPDTCAMCHDAKVQQFKKGKHAQGWTAMKTMPAMHGQPTIIGDGMKGCGGCHKIGIKTEAEIQELKQNSPGFGVASCDACHTRHTFSKTEAQQPQACQTCHMGFDHAQWEMYSSAKHGVRALLKQNQTLPAETAAPTCQTCHMQEGNHEVRTAWGFVAVRLPMPEDKAWAEDRKTILQALGVLDPAGNPTSRLDTFKDLQLVRLTQEEWQKERDKMTATCRKCHAPAFVKGEMQKNDQIIRETDKLMATAIRIVAGLYKDGIIAKPQEYAYPFPDLLTFHNAQTPIETRLFDMFLEHRNKTFQGAFHVSPDYTWWYGYSAMQRDLTEIKYMAEEMRARKAARKK